jgi:hypothetical protein
VTTGVQDRKALAGQEKYRWLIHFPLPLGDESCRFELLDAFFPGFVAAIEIHGDDVTERQEARVKQSTQNLGVAGLEFD